MARQVSCSAYTTINKASSWAEKSWDDVLLLRAWEFGQQRTIAFPEGIFWEISLKGQRRRCLLCEGKLTA